MKVEAVRCKQCSETYSCTFFGVGGEEFCKSSIERVPWLQIVNIFNNLWNAFITFYIRNNIKLYMLQGYEYFCAFPADYALRKVRQFFFHQLDKY